MKRVLVCSLAGMAMLVPGPGAGFVRADVWSDGHTVARPVPRPLPERPGNIHLDDEAANVKTPEDVPATAVRYRVVNDLGRELGAERLEKTQNQPPDVISLGRPGIGWYRVEFLDEAGREVAWTTAAVLARLAAPTPQDSPVCVDSATSWFASNNPADQRRLASLAALAGVNWIRDRLTWGHIETSHGRFTSQETTYDTAASIQNEFGLKVLQVWHLSPAWAADKTLDGDNPAKRFPRDLRHVYSFCKGVAQRYRGRVQAWEPWNEANIEMFGPHTVDEMCSYQKAAYLGFKAGDPDVTVGWNVYCTAPTPVHTQGLADNGAWAYFDTYNIHTYDWHEEYPRLWEPARRAAAGKPLWITEADRGAKYQSPEPWCELSREDELNKACYIAQAYAMSMFAGSQRHFQFILGNFHETWNGVQFGLLRKDMTPRPAYCALAAVGRLMAGAKIIGRLPLADKPDVHIYAFKAMPDGQARDVLVAWAEKRVDWPQRGKTSAPFSLPESVEPLAVYDYMGRSLPQTPNELGGAATFILLAPGETGKLGLEAPPAASATDGAAQASAAGPIVLQLAMPLANLVKVHPVEWSEGHEYQIDRAKPFTLQFYAYNFSPTPTQGRVAVRRQPDGWHLSQTAWELAIAPGERVGFAADLTIPADSATQGPTESSIILGGDFTGTAAAVLAFRIHGK